MQEEAKPLPIGKEFNIPGELLTTKQLFRTATTSDSYLQCLKPQGVERKFWDYGRIAQSSTDLFRLKICQPQALSSKKRLDALQTQTSVSLLGQTATDGVQAPPDTDGKPLKRADRYFQLLMKRHNQRIQASMKQELQEEQERAEGAAKQAVDSILARAHPEYKHLYEAKKEDGDFGPLTTYNGNLKVEIEVIVTRAPGETWDGSDMGSDRDSAASANSSRPSTPPVDFSDDLAKLTEEMKDHLKQQKLDDAAAAAADEDENSKKPKLGNIFKHPDPKWTLDLAGSIFFVPDAERYALAPSIPPPPPPSLQGRRRMHLKPRLPLEISNRRYRDEHPNVWPPDPYSPQVTDYTSFLQKMLTLDFYKTCSEGLSQLPQQTTAQDLPRHEEQFGNFVINKLKRSEAWEAWRKHERQRVLKTTDKQPDPPSDTSTKNASTMEPKLPHIDSAASLPPRRPKRSSKADVDVPPASTVQF